LVFRIKESLIKCDVRIAKRPSKTDTVFIQCFLKLSEGEFLKKSIWNKKFVMIFIINITTAMSFYLLSPTLPKYALTLGLTSTMAGMTTTIFVLAATAVRPFTGHLADTLNLRLLVAVSLVVIMLSIVGYSVFASVTMLMVFRIIHGFGWGLVTTATGTYASHALPEGKIGQGIGIFGLASVLASAAAPSIGLAISGMLGYVALFLFAAALSATGLLLCLLLPNLHAPNDKSLAPAKIPLLDRIISRKALLPSALVLLVVCSTSSISTFIAVYADKIGVANIGLFFTCSACAVFLARPLSGKLSDSVSKQYIVVPALVLTALSLVLIFLAKSIWPLLAAALVYGLGYGSLQPALQAWCVRNSGIEQRGRANSTFYMGLDVGMGIGALVAGAIADSIGYQGMYLCMIVPIALAAALFLITGRRERQALADGAATQNKLQG
jgi:MFS family permease